MNDEQLIQYSRHIMLPEIDYHGQQKLMQSHMAIIGLGGLGSPAAMYLAASGVGDLTLVDHDEVESSNLQRQILHHHADLGHKKTNSAHKSLNKINKNTNITTIAKKLDDNELINLARHVQVILDCTDNFQSRYQINKACFQTKTPLISGSAIQFTGQVTTFDYTKAHAPCYQCVFPTISPTVQTEENCTENGIFAPLVGMIGSLQAAEAIKQLLGLKTLQGQLWQINTLTMKTKTLHLKKEPNCPVCNETQKA